MSEPSNPLTNFPAGTVMGMSFTPDGDAHPNPAGDEPAPSESEQVPVPAEIPAIVRVVWEIDAHAEPLPQLQTGQLFTLHKTGEAAEMLTGRAPDELVAEMHRTAESYPESLTALPFQLPDDGLDFLAQLGRVVWSDEIEGVAVLYETDAMLTAADMAEAPADPQERKAFLEKKTAGQERSRFVVAATRTEAWSIVHPHFDTDPEHIEQGPALVADLLQLITNGMNGEPTPAS
ncbi:hypothetical protein [uncultured Mobiluncus sp.]|uniref:hypothetical protein n=1 Tax=uncultured Mobiluncus sp. TaxID=293425 RepID=UPI0025D21068|nr:hypothetical protein [uncultured Mobiluncus sp.]